MANKINEHIDLPESRKTSVNGDVSDIKPSKITETIGRGEDARNSFVYITLLWAFVVGSVITIIIVVDNWFFMKGDTNSKITDDIQIVWDIVVPIITLALGYAFGKSRD